jgi:hypothetical protein
MIVHRDVRCARGIIAATSASLLLSTALNAGADDACVPEPALLATGQFRALTVAAPYLYFVDESAGDELGGTLSRVSTEGGDVEALAEAPVPERVVRILADPPYLIGAVMVRPEHVQIWRTPLSGGNFSADEGGEYRSEVRSIANWGLTSDSLVVAEAAVSHYNSAHSIIRFARADASPGEQVATVGSLFGRFAFDDDAVYYEDGADAQVDLVRRPFDGSATNIVTSSLQTGPDTWDLFRDFVVAGNDLVFVTSERVGRAAITGGATTLLEQSSGYRVLADAEYVYYFTAADSTCTAGSELYRVPIAGGTPVQLFNEPAAGCVADWVQDDDALYWVKPDGTAIEKLTKHWAHTIVERMHGDAHGPRLRAALSRGQRRR